MTKTLRCALAATALLAAAASARAEVVTVGVDLVEAPLFVLAGEPVALPFAAGRPLTGVQQVGVHLVGDETYFRDLCWIDGDEGGSQVWRRDVLGVKVELQVGGQPLAEASLVYDPADHPADLGVALDAVLLLPGDDWTALADGTGALVVDGVACTYGAVYPEVCACDVAMTLTAVDLIVATDGSVPARADAWGAVKARYR